MSSQALLDAGLDQIQSSYAELKHIPSSFSNLLASYSSIPIEKQKEHVISVRDRAYKSYPYPCLGRWRFLELDLAIHPLYQNDVLPMLKDSAEASNAGKPDWIFLDLGCCLGQDVRKLLFDGADPARVYGADLRPELISIGYELFKDEDTFPRNEHFIAPADVFDFSADSELSKKCDGRVGILHSAAVFHLFNWEGQVKIAQRCLRLMNSKNGRVLICGAQLGIVNAGDFVQRSGGTLMFWHNGESWKRFWEEVVKMDSWSSKIKAVEVQAEGNTTQRHIGSIEKDARWMKWWVWVDFV